MISVIFCLVISFLGSGYAAIPLPDFNSGWLPIEAGNQTTISSARKNVAHGLGETPVLVDVQVKAIDGPNKDYIFQATGLPIRDDDFPEDFGNVMYVYDNTSVIVCAPVQHNHYYGSVIFIASSTYWQGPNQNYSSKSAMFRIRAWRSSTLPQSDFVSTNNTITAASAMNSYLEIPHGLGSYPVLVVCRVRFPENTTEYPGFHADSVGAGIIVYPYNAYRNIGYVVYGYNDQHIRVWTLSDQHGALFDGTDGSGINASVRTGYLEIFAWTLNTLEPDDFDKFSLVPAELAGSEIDIEEESLTRAMAQANNGPNAYYRFPGSGSMAYSKTAVESPCSYGGLVYAYKNQSARFWKPVGENGSAICIQHVFGNGINAQASSDIGLSVFTWKTASGPVTSFTVKTAPEGNFRNMLITWKAPKTSGEVKQYAFSFNGTVKKTTYLKAVSDQDFTYARTVEVVPEQFYRFEVFAIYSFGHNGTIIKRDVHAPAGIPPNTVEVETSKSVIADVSDVGQNRFTLSIVREFFEQETNGVIRTSGLVGCVKDKCTGEEQLTLEEFNSMDTWQVASKIGFTDYRITHADWLKRANVSASPGRRSRSQDTVDYTVGLRNCANTPVNIFCNGPLEAGKEYIIVAVACTSGGCLLSKQYGPFRTQDDCKCNAKKTITVAVVMGAIIFILSLYATFVTVKFRNLGHVQANKKKGKECKSPLYINETFKPPVALASDEAANFEGPDSQYLSLDEDKRSEHSAYEILDA